MQQGVKFAAGQLVLLKRTPVELQQAHTKLTDKYDHICRVVGQLPSGVVFRVVPIAGGEELQVNQRNLRPFYEDDGDTDVDALQAPRLPLAEIPMR